MVLFNAGLDEFEELGAISYVGQTERDAGVRAGERLAEAGITNAIVINHQQGQLTLELRIEGLSEGLGTEVHVGGRRRFQPDRDPQRCGERAATEPRRRGA